MYPIAIVEVGCIIGLSAFKNSRRNNKVLIYANATLRHPNE